MHHNLMSVTRKQYCNKYYCRTASMEEIEQKRAEEAAASVE